MRFVDMAGNIWISLAPGAAPLHAAPAAHPPTMPYYGAAQHTLLAASQDANLLNTRGFKLRWMTWEAISTRPYSTAPRCTPPAAGDAILFAHSEQVYPPSKGAQRALVYWPSQGARRNQQAYPPSQGGHCLLIVYQ
jgi:hypothetical protein